MATELLLATVRLSGPSWTRLWVVSGNPHRPLCGWPLEASLERVENGWRCTAKRPKGATTLMVGHRPSRPPETEWTQSSTDREKARAAFDAANAALGFAPLRCPPDEGPWEGTVDQAGCPPNRSPAGPVHAINSF